MLTKKEKCSITQKNRIVIHKGDEEKRVFKNELPKYINDGWELGIKDSHKKSISKVRKGKPNPNKGKHVNTNSSTKWKKGHIPWNKGLTAEKDERVMRNVQKSKESKIYKYGSAFPNNVMTDEHRKKIGQSNKNKVYINKGGITKSVHKNDVKKYIENGWKYGSDPKKLQIKLNKDYITKKKNKTFNSSSSEDKLYECLLEENRSKTIFRNYKDDKRYPFYCDFYIVEDDLFIELNAHWTHGGHPFDQNSEEDIRKLEEWKEKAKTSKFYENAIETWTVRDVQKQKCAKENNLNYKVIY